MPLTATTPVRAVVALAVQLLFALILPLTFNSYDFLGCPFDNTVARILFYWAVQALGIWAFFITLGLVFTFVLSRGKKKRTISVPSPSSSPACSTDELKKD